MSRVKVGSKNHALESTHGSDLESEVVELMLYSTGDKGNVANRPFFLLMVGVRHG